MYIGTVKKHDEQKKDYHDFAQIFEKLPLENWYNMYILHEVGEETLWDKTLGHYIKF